MGKKKKMLGVGVEHRYIHSLSQEMMDKCRFVENSYFGFEHSHELEIRKQKRRSGHHGRVAMSVSKEPLV